MAVPAESRLQLAIVLGTSEDTCTVVADGPPVDVRYAAVFPRPRAERVAPGHLVAIAAGADGRGRVVWRWFDAVVLARVGTAFRIWEPVHGEVTALPRDPDAAPALGTRAYASAGLPGADWWLAGPTVSRADRADVELDDVARFLTDNNIWTELG